MKKVLVLALCYLFLVPLKAVNYCAPSSWGYAGNVTGGGNATPTLVTNESELSAALNKKNSVIIITQDITVTNHISSDKSNLTIMALPGKKLISNKQNANNSGILYLKGSNIILRNIIFEGPGAYDCDGWDNLCLDKATNVWVDHCDFQDGVDGNFDINQCHLVSFSIPESAESRWFRRCRRSPFLEFSRFRFFRQAYRRHV